LKNFDEVFEGGEVSLSFFDIVAQAFFGLKNLPQVLSLEKEV
jgi:hypothetical protein